MKRIHAMPFGARVDSRATHFSLWAPAAARVDLVLEIDGDEDRWPMTSRESGWYDCAVEHAGGGTRYAFRIDDTIDVPDPASRANPDGVHALSAVVDPAAYEWFDGSWSGRPWDDAVIYELHVGTFSDEGTFAAAIPHLDALADLGVTALELMPVAAFAGTRNWGYDGVLPFAPAASYGTPDDMKRLIDAAHARGLMVLLDVVYNHFGPEGNYLHRYAPQFFNAGRSTPWGAAINFDGKGSATVREFFFHNALYWLEEFHLDGLRIDACHAIADTSQPDFLTELAQRVRARFGDSRRIHLVLENDGNEARYLARDGDGRPRVATAQWNDDLHHALHVLATGETDGYYADYAERPLASLGRALAEGFAYQGEASAFRGGRRRGEPSGELPPTAFVAFAQNHDQIGNRALGDRLSPGVPSVVLRALTACVLLAPQIPLLFMGEEFAAQTPFLFFCDFGGELAQAVTSGRRREFARFARFATPSAREAIPDPNANTTFAASKLDWSQASARGGVEMRGYYRACLDARRHYIVPLLAKLRRGGSFQCNDEGLLNVEWRTDDGRRLHLVANFGRRSARVAVPPGEFAFASDVLVAGTAAELSPYAVAIVVEQAA